MTRYGFKVCKMHYRFQRPFEPISHCLSSYLLYVLYMGKFYVEKRREDEGENESTGKSLDLETFIPPLFTDMEVCFYQHTIEQV